MMLNHIHEEQLAERIKAAYNTILEKGDPKTLNRVLGGEASTQGFADAVIKAMK